MLLLIASSPAISIVVKATVALVVALAAARLARRARASLRHALLASAFAAILSLPVLTLLLPAVQVPIVSPDADAFLPVTAIEQITRSGGERPAAVPGDGAAMHPSVSMASLLLSVWAFGACLAHTPVAVALFHLRHLRRTGLPALDMLPDVNDLVRGADLRRGVDVLLHEDVHVPMTYGIIRPTVLLPMDADRWPAAERHDVLVHELEHIRRSDWLLHLMARVTCSVYWFHPLAWVAWHQMTLDAERACDDVVVQRTDGTVYAHHLVTMARRLSARTTIPAIPMARRLDLTARVSAILRPDQSRGRLGRASAIAIAVATAAVTLPTSALQAVQVTGKNEAAGQNAAADSPTFEAASLKLNVSGPGPFRIMPTPGRLRGTNVPAKFLLAAAFAEPGAGPLHYYRIIGGPEWLDSARFDLDAKAPESVRSAYEGPPVVLFAMLRSLLTEQFKLVARVEKRELPVYTLVKSRRDGQLGPQLVRRSAAECDALTAQMKNSGSPPATTPDGKPLVGFRTGIDRITGGCTRLRFLVDAISWSPSIDRLIVDRTDLDGLFDYDLTWTPDQAPQAGSPVGGPSGAAGTSLFTALDEQLGLKVEGNRGPVDVVVIERAEMPTGN